MKLLRIQNYLQFHSLIVVSKLVKHQKHQRKSHISGDHRMISALCEFFYNSPNSQSLMQVKIYRYQNSLLKKPQKLLLPLTFSKSDESIKSGTCFSSIFSSHFLHLSFTRAGSGTLSILLSSKRSLSKLVNE